MRSKIFVLVLSLAAACLIGCGGDPLDYDTAMNLLRDRTNDPVRTNFSASPRSENEDPKVADAYKKLVDGHVLQCKPNAAVGTLCEPGPAGDVLSQQGVSDLSFVAGRWAPATILSMRRTGRNSATAEVRMNFEASPLFQEYEDAFDLIQSPGAAMALSTRKQGKVAHVTFQRYDDGWHVEAVE